MPGIFKRFFCKLMAKKNEIQTANLLNLLVLSQSFIFPLRFPSAFSISCWNCFSSLFLASNLLLIVSSILSLILSECPWYFSSLHDYYFSSFLLFNHLWNQLIQFVKSIANLIWNFRHPFFFFFFSSCLLRKKSVCYLFFPSFSSVFK